MSWIFLTLVLSSLILLPLALARISLGLYWKLFFEWYRARAFGPIARSNFSFAALGSIE